MVESSIDDVVKNLPIYEFKDRIIDLVKENLFSVITGETGSGKSTQIS
jgi:HrpA-like RNA helicase